MTEILETKKAMILRAAAAIGAEKWTPAEIDQLRRNDLPQPQSGSPQTRRKGRNRQLVPRLAGKSRAVFRLAGSAQAGPGLPGKISQDCRRRMNIPANGAAEPEALDLPAFSLDVASLDLGAGVKAI